MSPNGASSMIVLVKNKKKTIEETKPFSSDCPDLELFVTDRKTLCQSYGPVTTAIESA